MNAPHKPTPGAVTGAAIAQVMAKTLNAHKSATQGTDVQTHVLQSTQLSKFIHAQLAPAFTALLAKHADNPETPEPIRALLAPIAHSALDVIGHVMTQALAEIIGFGLSSALEPFATELRQLVWPTLPIAALSPADAAAAVVQNVDTKLDFPGEASKSGVDSQRFSVLTELQGLPPGPADLLAMWRRGLIDQATFERGIRQGHTKDEWIPHIEATKEVILTPDIAAAMVVQNVIPEAEGEAVAAKGGVNAADFQNIVKVHGRPASPTEAIELFRRDPAAYGQGFFNQVIAESDVKTKYAAALWDLRYKLPTTPQILHIIATGAAPKALTDSLLAKTGFEPDVAAALTNAAAHSKTAKARGLAEAQILELYEASYIGRPDADTLLKGLGFDAATTTMLLETTDAKREKKFLDHYISVVHAKYVAHLSDRNTASSRLDALGLPSKARDDLLHLWDQERSANVRVLSVSEIARAVTDGFIDYPTGVAKLQTLGYAADDAAIILQLSMQAPPKKPRASGPKNAPQA